MPPSDIRPDEFPAVDGTGFVDECADDFGVGAEGGGAGAGFAGRGGGGGEEGVGAAKGGWMGLVCLVEKGDGDGDGDGDGGKRGWVYHSPEKSWERCSRVTRFRDVMMRER